MRESVNFVRQGLLLSTFALCIAGVGLTVAANTSEPESHSADHGMSAHMAEHFAEAIMLQTAVVNGDLESAKGHARWLAEHEPPSGIPDDATEPLFAFQQAARDVLIAEGIHDAADATARLGKACGDCHGKLGVSNHIASTVPPPLGDGVANRMARHLWAADRMWESLAAPSESVWYAAAEELMEAPLSSQELVGADHDLVNGLSGRVVDLAKRARDSVSWKERAAVYGEFLSTCASCHRAFRN